MENYVSIEFRNRGVIASINLPVLDMFNAPGIMDEIKEALDKEPEFMILDMNKTTHIDSSGIGVIMRIQKLVNDYQGKLIIVGLNKKIAHLFHLTQTDKFLSLVSTIEEALEGL